MVFRNKRLREEQLPICLFPNQCHHVRQPPPSPPSPSTGDITPQVAEGVSTGDTTPVESAKTPETRSSEKLPRAEGASSSQIALTPAEMLQVEGIHSGASATVREARLSGKLGMKFLSMPPGPVEVRKVTQRGWAEQVGIQAGDLLISANGMDPSRMASEEFEALLWKRPLRLLVHSPEATM